MRHYLIFTEPLLRQDTLELLFSIYGPDSVLYSHEIWQRATPEELARTRSIFTRDFNVWAEEQKRAAQNIYDAYNKKLKLKND